MVYALYRLRRLRRWHRGRYPRGSLMDHFRHIHAWRAEQEKARRLQHERNLNVIDRVRMAKGLPSGWVPIEEAAYPDPVERLRELGVLQQNVAGFEMTEEQLLAMQNTPRRS